MLFGDLIDVFEDELHRREKRLLDVLLFDRASRRNIIWATDSYSDLGDGYAVTDEMRPELITGVNKYLIRPRILKSAESQDIRTRINAEVFTPCWVCNNQNNLVDEQWFGRTGVFNTECGQAWTVNEAPIPFPEEGPRTWKCYVDAKRLEIACGEAPYLVSRYDTVTGEPLPVTRRIGLLDRKLRVVNENTDTEAEWTLWAERAFQSVYGYEYQGDSLLLARENLLMTYMDYFQDRFQRTPARKTLLRIARIISWNIWQMDGTKYVIPLSCHEVVLDQYSMFGGLASEPCPGCKAGNPRRHNGIYCKVMDWRAKQSFPYINLIGGEES